MGNRRLFIKQSFYSAISLGLYPLLPGETFSFIKSEKSVSYPVVIQSVDLLKWRNHHFVVVTSADGVQGVTLANTRIDYLYSIFNDLVKPFFLGKDARQLPQLIDGVYRDERNYKFSGMPFWNCVGHIEIALWDLLGKIEDKPVYRLLGTPLRKQVNVYLSSLTRANSAEEEFEKIIQRLALSGCRAVKIKIGGRMGTDEKADARSYKIVKLLRLHSDSLIIYADANGSFDVKQGIAMGKFLEEHNADIYEEPCNWEDFEANKKVRDAMTKIKIAGGEQDTSYYRFQWYCSNKGLDVLQPDVFYNGGMLRTYQIAQLADQYKVGFAPHSPKADPLAAPFLHLASVAPALYGYQEYPLSGVGQTQPDWYEPKFEVKDGKLNIPEGPGLGIRYDPVILHEATKLK